MFCVQIAGVVIGIDNQYSFLENLCRAYRVTGREPAFTVSASSEEIRQAMEESEMDAKDSESICICRKIALELIRYDAFLMHCAVIAMDGEGYAFAARSGTGKTTHIRLWKKVFGRRAVVVNGDKPILRFIDGTLYACGSPWRGKEYMGQNMMVPLKTVYFIQRGAENFVRPLSNAEVVGRIFHQLLMPSDPELADRFLSLVDRMLEQTEFCLLTCNMEPEAALVAYGQGRQGGISNAENQKRFYPQKNGLRIYGRRHWGSRSELQRYDTNE